MTSTFIFHSPGELHLVVPSGIPKVLLGLCKGILALTQAWIEYLTGKCFEHRDLAARNILVAEDRVCNGGLI